MANRLALNRLNPPYVVAVLAGALLMFSVHTSASATMTNDCAVLQDTAKEAAEKAVERVKKSEHYKVVQDERIGAFDCQMAISGELSSWVTGKVNMGFLDSLFNEMSSSLTKQACDEFKRRARQASAKLGDLSDLVRDLPATLEEAERYAKEVAERTAKEYANDRLTQVINKLPDYANQNGYGYNYPYQYQTPDGYWVQDPWAVIRDLWNSTSN